MTTVERFLEFALLGMLVSAFASVGGSGLLDTIAVVSVSVALFVRLVQLVARIDVRVKESTLNAITAVYVVFFAADWVWLSGNFLDATVHLLFFLAVARLFTARTRSSRLSLQLIALLAIVAGAILSASTTFLPSLTAFLVFSVAALAGSEMRRSAQGVKQVVGTGPQRAAGRLWVLCLSMTGGILILTAIFFFLLPRTARVAFQHMIPDKYRVPGFSNEVDLGRIGPIKRIETPVLHVRGLDGVRRMPALRWRGGALREFDGKRWFNPPEAGEVLSPQQGLIRLADNEQRWRSGQRAAYEVELTAIASDTLFVAGTPEFLQISLPFVLRMPQGTLRSTFGLREGIRYGVYAFLESPESPGAPALLSASSRISHLALPAIDPRVANLAREWATPQEIERRFRTEFGYTREQPDPLPPDPLAHFLLERRKGHCEYFASAMAVMLRTLGIPSRVVTGFSQGTFNPVSGWQVIRASDAHSWVEAWIDGATESGGAWVTFDPTPPDPGAMAPGGWLERAGFWVDALDTFWRDWVLNYTIDQQLTLAARAEQARFRAGSEWLSRSGDQIVRGLPWIVGVAAVVFLIRRVKLPGFRRTPHHEASKLYRQMLTKLHLRGIEKPAWMTPQEFVAQLPDAPWRAAAVSLTNDYYGARFGRNSGLLDRMRATLKRI